MSGRVLFVTSDEFIADNRKKMGWIVEEVKMTSREQFEAWFPSTVVGMPENMVKVFDEMLFMAWQASRAAIEVELPDVDDKKWYSSWHGAFRAEAFWLETRRVLNGYGLKVKK